MKQGIFLFFSLFFPMCLSASPLLPSPSLSLEARYQHLDPLSLKEQLAFYHLYPDSNEGKKALEQAWTLLQGSPESSESAPLFFPKLAVEGIISLVTRQSFSPPPKLEKGQLDIVQTLGKKLGNRKLRGYSLRNKEEFDHLPTSEIDLARGLLLNQFEETPDQEESIKQYEATLDLMALQILARLPKGASPRKKIDAINTFIFYDMRFRYPPRSLYPDHIDYYTFLPSVLDGRQGICLGVSILYLCLAQRLELPLEIITPPGHIYVRYRDDSSLINIETTARGIDTPSEAYLGINTRLLPQRSLREVLGMAHFNHASIAWSNQNYPLAVTLYKKAAVYQQEDPHLKMFFGMSLVMAGHTKEGTKLLQEVASMTTEEAVSKETFVEDYLAGNVSLNGLKAIFQPVDETRESIVKKQEKLKKVVKRHPKFRAGLFQLATTYLQQSRLSEALEFLERYHSLDPTDATVEYYICLISIEQFDFNKAWAHYKRVESITKQREYQPKALTSLKAKLLRASPIPG